MLLEAVSQKTISKKPTEQKIGLKKTAQGQKHKYNNQTYILHLKMGLSFFFLKSFCSSKKYSRCWVLIVISTHKIISTKFRDQKNICDKRKVFKRLFVTIFFSPFIKKARTFKFVSSRNFFFLV